MQLEFTDYVRYTCPHCGYVTETSWGGLKVTGLGSCMNCHRRLPENTEIIPCDPKLAREYFDAKAKKEKEDKEAAEAIEYFQKNAAPISCGCFVILAIACALIYFFIIR